MIYIILGFLLVIMMWACMGSSLGTDATSITDESEENIRVLGRQTLRWSTASYQDQNPMIAVLHANYGVAYLAALKDIAREDAIERVLDVDLREFKKWVYNAQDSATRKMIRACPEYGPVIPEFVRRLSDE